MSLGFRTRFDTNRAVQPKKMFEISDLRLCYLFSENKGADQLHGCCPADLRLCFRLCKSRFSHDAAPKIFRIFGSIMLNLTY